MKPEEKTEEENGKDKKRPKEKGKEKEKNKDKGKDTDKDLKDRIVSFFSSKAKGRGSSSSRAKSANQLTVLFTNDPKSPIESSNERMPPRREHHPEGDSDPGRSPNSLKASGTSSPAYSSPSAEKSPAQSTPKPPSSKPSDASALHASPSAKKSSSGSVPKPPDSKPADASPGHEHPSPCAEKSPSDSAPKLPNSKPHDSKLHDSKPHDSKPHDSKPPDASPGQTSASADSFPAKPTPSADSGLSSSASNQEQAVEQAAHESDSTTTQPAAQSSDSSVTHAITPPPVPPTPPAPLKAEAPPPEASEAPAAEASKADIAAAAPQPSPEAPAAAAPVPSQPSRGGLVGFDESFSKKLAIWTSDGWAKSVMKAFVRGTHAVAWLIWMPVIILSTPPASSLREQLVNLYRGIIWTGIVVLILRVVCKRPKPPKLDGSDPSPYSAYTDLYSFPSNSSAMTMLACRFLTVNYGDGTVTLVATLLVILVALAVLTLGRHYLFDVIVGWIIGIVIFCVSKRMWIPMDKCDQHVKRILDALHI